MGCRKVDGGTEYLFAVRSEDPKAPMGVGLVHVMVNDSTGAKPEFTLVERED